ncbi:MAG: mechanosensitive ion channel family protein [Dongiaceae bacterium]
MAQDAPAESGALSQQQIDELVTTLEDPAARDKLIGQLKALRAIQRQAAETAEPEGLGAAMLNLLSQQMRQASDALVGAAAMLLDAPRLLSWFARQAADPAARQRWLEVIVKLAVILAAAMAAEWLTGRLLRRPRRALSGRAVDHFWMRLPLAAARLFLDLVPIMAFALFAFGALAATQPSETARLVALAVINANVIARVVVALARAVLAPRAPGLRLAPVGDETASYLAIWARRLTATTVYGYFLTEAALLLGLPAGLHGFALRVVGVLVAAMLVVVILQNRGAVAQWLKGSGAAHPLSGLRQWLAEVWHILAILYVLGCFAVWALDIAGGFSFLLRATVLTVIVIAIVKIIAVGLRRGVARGFALSGEMTARLPGLEARANRYLPLLQRILSAVVYLVAGIALLQIWGADAFGWLGSDLGQQVTGSLITIAFIVIGAMLLSELVNEFVERYLQRRQAEDAARGQRWRTLLPLLRNAFRVVLLVMVTLIVLSEFGVNIAPLIAGAGVVGLAVGFGAQTLVKDIITGIFILAEDTIAVGDVVDIDGHTGTVESMNLRNVRVRDHTGALHTIPFSAINAVRNMTRDFGYAVFDVGISYREDLDRVVQLLRDIGEELRRDAGLGRDIREPIDVAGINRLADTSVIIRARIKTAVGKQWGVEREFNRRLKQRFEELGIERANPAAPAVYVAEARMATPT